MSAQPPAHQVVTIGESMLLAVPPAPGRLRHAPSVLLKMAGAESNVAIGLARLGVRVAWAGLLGDDEPGRLVLDRIRAEGVDTSGARLVPGRPTGLFLREEVAGQVRVYYYRQGSAASTMAPGSVDPARLDGASYLHLTGVTAALSPDCAEFVLWAAKEARSRGVRVSFDVNYRSRLWEAPAARATVEEVLPHVDLLFVSTEEAAALWGWTDDDAAVAELAAAGPSEVVVKRGRHGSSVWTDGGRVDADPFAVRQVDPIGAGDAFAAGYLAAALAGADPTERLRRANAMGALSVSTLGDYEGLPSAQELTDFVDGTTTLGR
ncbi:MAG TPA: sugar kinase [Nocardioidaceae bacterium]|jgi:2-dehydro-3-deoxygluconokinase